ncbi:hypothetical protein IWW36_000729 [Coemansia brasiliensis]|uniref:ACT domain-containing protein n=1 Tax=Coemansia brasiliensis TaxID=2650707 RepID=A0A9W8IGX9_9FUNG|nr:hypothetical protein IWW36_000729 [Coemansia brasiliensis]
MNNYYPGGRDIFKPVDPDIPGPGTYDVHSPEVTYKKYGFLSHGERFKEEKVEERVYESRALSRAGSQSRRNLASTMSAVRAEEARLKREIEYYQKTLQEQQTSAAKEARVLRDKMQQAEDKVKELLRERTEIKKRLTQREIDLRAKERECGMVAAQLEKQQQQVMANPKAEKQLRESAEQASQMCEKLKSTLDKARRNSEEDKRRIRKLELHMRKLEQEKEKCEVELKQMQEAEFPRQMQRLKRELRQQEEQYRERVRKLGVELQESKDLASRYMTELGEANVHVTALESEIQVLVERQKTRSSGTSKQLDAAMQQLEDTQARLTEVERISKQRTEESERLLDAARGHIDELQGEIARLEQEREQVQHEMQGRIHELTQDYQAAKREFETSVRGAGDERTKRLHDTQSRLERATQDVLELKAEVSELRGVLLQKEMAWKDQKLAFESDLQAAAADYEALQARMQEQRRLHDARIEAAEAQLLAKEQTWQRERTGILAKLDQAHKDAFRLRDALDIAEKDNAQTKADCEADVLRINQELSDARAELDAQQRKWDAEQREIMQTHTEEISALRDECTMLEQQLRDDRQSLEQQLQDAREEISEHVRSHDEQVNSLQEQLNDTQALLEQQVRENRSLETRIMEADAAAAERTDELEARLEEMRLEHAQALRSVDDKHAKELRELQARAENDRADAAELRDENEILNLRVRELEETNAQMSAECVQLHEMVDELEAGQTQADALAHYIQLLQQLDARYRAEKKQWAGERTELQERLARYRFREGMWATQIEHTENELAATEEARVHMVGQARAMYEELLQAWDEQAEQAEISLLLATAGTEPGEDPSELQDIAGLVRTVFVDGIRRAQNAQKERACVENTLQELKFMRVQGQIVETVGEMSQKHKAERHKLESDLEAARADYRKLHEVAASSRKQFEAQVSELESRISELTAVSALPQNNAAQLEAENAALSAQVKQLAALNADMDQRLEVFEISAADEHNELAQKIQMLESHNTHMTRLLEQCEVDMATNVQEINQMGQRIAELESERAILAEQSQFQIAWLKENYSKAYRDLDIVLNNDGGHSNLRQRIRYVESLKTQILGLKKESFEYARDRDRFKHQVQLLKSELNAYKEVGDVDASRVRSRMYSQTTAAAAARRNKPANDTQSRSTLGKRGAEVVSKALDDARQLRLQQMTIEE